MKSRLRAITIATLIFAATLLPPASSRALSLHPRDTQMSEAERKHFLDGEFRIIKDTKEFPAPIVKILCGTVELRSCMANPGERFNATDVIGDLRIPGRRLLFAGVLGDKYFVYYEQGGIALFHQISFFTVSGTDSVTTLWRGHCYGPIVNIEQLRQRVTGDACLK